MSTDAVAEPVSPVLFGFSLLLGFTTYSMEMLKRHACERRGGKSRDGPGVQERSGTPGSISFCFVTKGLVREAR